MKNSDDTHGAAVSPGHIVGGGHYSLHVPLDDTGFLWLAQDEEQQRLAAIRFLPPEIRDDPHARDLLRERVEPVATVQNESVCRVIEWYESPGVETFIATEYVEGTPLIDPSGKSDRKAVSWESLSAKIANVAAGLEALHRAGVVHHGLKPENILLCGDERVKLVNAVVAGVLMNPLFLPSALNDPIALRCCSPQQLAGQEPSMADDFYSLGATLFELLTGTSLFPNENSLLQDVQSTLAPSLRERLHELSIANSVPDELIEFVDACLNKDASRRPQSLECLLPVQAGTLPASSILMTGNAEPVAVVPKLQLAEVLPDSPLRSELELIQNAKLVQVRSSQPWAIAAVLFLLAGVAAGWVFLNHQNREREQRIAAIAAEESRQRETAEKEKREAELRLKKEVAARLKSEEIARKAEEETARLAAAAQEKQRQEVETQARLEHDQIATAQKEAEELERKKPAPPPLPSADSAGFVAMFNGLDLTDWVGDTNHWSVRDSIITAQSRADDEKQRFLLVWQKGNVGDFEMQFSYRFRLLRGNKHPNGGVNYRLTAQTNLTCYQFDLVTNPKDNGSVNDDKKRYRLAGYGDSVTANSSKHELIERLGDTNILSAIRPEDWNKCVIIAKGNRLTHYINGELVADVTDESKSKRHLNGLIALELYTRSTNNCATFLQFNDLKLKRLGVGGEDPLVSANR